MISRLWPIAFVLGCSSPSAEPASTRPVVVAPPVFEADASAPPPPITLEDPDGQLVPLYRAIAAAEAGEPDGRALIAQFGDSHTAADRLTGHLRRELQARFGDAGRGFVLTGRPKVKWYELIDVTYGTDGAWRSDQGGAKGAVEPFGLGATRSYASKATAEAWVATCADCDAGRSVARFEVFFLRQPDGGVIEARIDDGAWTPIPTDGEAAAPDFATLEVADGEHRLTLRPKAKAGEVDVFGVALERPQPGVIVEALGVVGRQLAHLYRWDWTVIGPQLARRAPALVILQYGTNEVDDEDLDVAVLEERYVEVIGRIRAAVPDAGVLVLGPPDMARRAETRKRCDAAERKQQVVEGCAWRTPAELAAVITAERNAARRTGAAFFDSFAAMGGADVMDAMVGADPALAYGDRVHFTGKGYAIWADLLREDLMRGYEAWQKLAATRR